MKHRRFRVRLNISVVNMYKFTPSFIQLQILVLCPDLTTILMLLKVKNNSYKPEISKLSAKGQMINILGFEGHTLFISTAQLCHLV